MNRRIASLLLAAGTSVALVLPIAASADPLPSYAVPGAARGETISGTISSVPSNGSVIVRDDRGFVDRISLHDRTVINPTGISLGAGQSVTIVGSNAGATFRADEIDVRDASAGSSYGYAPSDGYDPGSYGYPYPYGYPYGYYGPYAYGYYPYGVGFYFGGRGYCCGRGWYGHGWGGRGYGGHGYGGGYHGGYGGRGVASGRAGITSHASIGAARGSAGVSRGGGGRR